MANLLEALSFNIRGLRDQKGLTQQQLADQADVGLQVIKNVETQRVLPVVDNLAKIAKAFGVEETRLFQDPAIKPTKEEAVNIIIHELGVAHLFSPPKKTRAPQDIPDDILTWSASDAHPEDWENIREYIKIGKEHRQRIEAGEQNNHAPSKLTVTSTFEERVLDRLRKLDQIDQKDLEDWLDRLLAKRKEKKKAKDAG